ncbi:MAG: hypothetical protein GY940_33965, partial [bacterium]|nr:hypothetical protein [bacterium]
MKGKNNTGKIKARKTDALDRDIARRVGSVEREVPPELERTVMEALETITPGDIEPMPVPGKPKRSRVYYWPLATAAAVVLAVLIAFFFYMTMPIGCPKPGYQEEMVGVRDTFV